MIEDLFRVAISVMNISEDYCNDEDGIQDLVKKFKERTCEMDKNENFATCVGKVCNNVNVLANLLSIKKLEKNREDMLVLINLLEKEVENLKVIAKEVDVNVITSK